MRICFVCCEYPPSLHGGIGTFTQVLSRALVAAGHEVRVTGVYPASRCAAEYEEDEGVRVWRFPQPRHRIGWVWGRRQLRRQIAVWCRRGVLDLVEVPDWGGWAAGWPRFAPPVVARLHGSATYFAAELNAKVRSTTYWLERESLRRADFCCSVSQYAADKTRQLFGLRNGTPGVLYSVVQPMPASGTPVGRSRTHVIFTGTLTYKKGVTSLFKAWPLVLRDRPDARLHVYGKDGRTDDGGSMKSLLLAQLNEAQRASVEFHGHVSRTEMLNGLREARVGIFPSYAETFGLSPAEAMALGCPTIYSDRTCGREVIRHGRDGLLIDPDRPEEIAAAALQLLNDDALARRLGEAGRRRIEENFSIAALLPKNERFYRDCIDTKAARCS